MAEPIYLTDDERRHLGNIRSQLSYTPHLWGSEIVTLDRLLATPKSAIVVHGGCIYSPGQRCRGADRCQFPTRCARDHAADTSAAPARAESRCDHSETERGSDIPLVYGSHQSEVCKLCGWFRRRDHQWNLVGEYKSRWRPPGEYADATESAMEIDK